MEEIPIRKFNRLGVLSLCLGILAFLTSTPFWFLVYWIGIYFCERSGVGYCGSDTFYLVFFFLAPISLVLGLAALITGIISKKRTIGKNGVATAGIVLGIFAILFGLLTSFLALRIM